MTVHCDTQDTNPAWDQLLNIGVDQALLTDGTFTLKVKQCAQFRMFANTGEQGAGNVRGKGMERSCRRGTREAAAAAAVAAAVVAPVTMM